MKRFVEGSYLGQSTLVPECLGDRIGDDNKVGVIDVCPSMVEEGYSGAKKLVLQPSPVVPSSPTVLYHWL